MRLSECCLYVVLQSVINFIGADSYHGVFFQFATLFPVDKHKLLHVNDLVTSTTTGHSWTFGVAQFS